MAKYKGTSEQEVLLSEIRPSTKVPSYCPPSHNAGSVAHSRLGTPKYHIAKMKRSRDSEDENDTAGHGEDAALIPVSKILNLDTETELRLEANAIQCSLPGHAKGTSFTNYREYERHYVQVHTNRCLECARNFPSSHVMCLHIHEHHDALAEMKREQGISTVSACYVSALNGLEEMSLLNRLIVRVLRGGL